MDKQHPIVIIETEYLVALDIELSICSVGYKNIQIFGSAFEGQPYIRNNKISLAIIACTPNDPDCVRTAEILKARNIPFIVCSGSEEEDAQPVFDERAFWISKPHEHAALVEAVDAILC